MDCKHHQGVDASYACSFCGQPICLPCTVELNKKAYCKECLEKNINYIPVNQKVIVNKRKSKFLTLLLGFVPGAGHMYIGLLNKGLSLMVIFFAALFLALFISDTLRIGWFQGFLIPAISVLCLFYSIFDALELADQINSGKVVNDTSLAGSIMEINYLKQKFFYRRKTVGYAFLILGAIGIANIFIETLDNLLRKYLHFIPEFRISQLMVPMLFIIIGVYLIRKSSSRIEM